MREKLHKICLEENGLVICHRKETHVQIVCAKTPLHYFIVSKDNKGLYVENVMQSDGLLAGKRPCRRKTRIKPGEIIAASGVSIQFGVKRKGSSGFSQARVERIRNVYRTLFQSLQEMKPFATRGTLLQEGLLRILKVIPARRALFIEKRKKAFSVAHEKKRNTLRTGPEEINFTLVRRAQNLRQTVSSISVRLGKNKEPAGLFSSLCTPVFQKKKIAGFLYLDLRSKKNFFRSIHVEILEGISRLVSTLLKSTEKILHMQKKSGLLVDAYFRTITALAASIETRDNYTVAHTQRVTRIAEHLARHLRWPVEKMKHIRLGGILHDIGKIAIRDEILKKPGSLTEEEREEMEQHPQIGANLVKSIRFLKPVIPYILAHQEHFDGKGYPYHLKGKNIPAEGRLMAIADAFDAMTSDRPYRKALPSGKAIEEIIRNRGRQFDPEMVDVFCDLCRKGVILTALSELGKKSLGLICPSCASIVSKEPDSKGKPVCLDCGQIIDI